ncbi:hypothetical protein JD292_06785 [Leucobacter sp. CSA2]|uniref:LPXTG cell wall anchor domain-containing protein n=1 Tax=Leucobacter edaphi TaxID=2796472 RepID=A0A934QEP6_9MICO|nr:SpaA isopeptide-forming pilin-related protein [Leucobacter edaphi]MBK0421777.1 hypothetical protein [Leucobacter edaphi]
MRSDLGCSYAAAGSGAYAKSICWIDMTGFTTQYSVVTDPNATSSTTCRRTGFIFVTYYCKTTGSFESAMGGEYGSWTYTTGESYASRENDARAASLATFNTAVNTSTQIYRAPSDGTYWGNVTGVPVSFSLSSALRFTAKANISIDTASPDRRGLAVRATATPTGGWAGMGNNNVYTGISGQPALFQPTSYDTGRSTTTALTMSDIELKKSDGTPITSGYSIVTADAEVTTAGESISWSSAGGAGFRWLPNDPVAWANATTDLARKQAAVGSNGCAATPASEFPAGSDVSTAPTRTCTGDGTGPRNGSAMLQISPAGTSPFSVTQRMRAGGTQAVAFGVMTTGAEVKVAVADRIVNASGAPSSTNFGAKLTPMNGQFGESDAVTSTTGATALTGAAARLRVPAATGGFQFAFSGASVSDTYLSSYTPNWVCSKTSSTSTTSIPWTGNGTLANPQQNPPPATWAKLNAGEFAECTVTYIPPYLTLTKQVDNTLGGSATPDAWTLTGSSSQSRASGKTGSPGATRVPVAIGSYALTESGAPAGYRWKDLSCDSPAGTWTKTGGGREGIVSGSVSVSKLANTKCTFTNAYEGTRLTLQKRVNNAHGGAAAPTDWTLSADGPVDDLVGVSGSPGVTDVPIRPGTYVLTERGGPAGYRGSWACDINGAPAQIGAGGAVAIPLGGTAVCTATNSDLPGSVTWSKVDESGSRLSGSAWDLRGPGLPVTGLRIQDCSGAPCGGSGISDTDARSGEFALTGLRWGQYTLTEAIAPPGYKLDATPRTFVVGGTAPGRIDQSLGQITNVQISAPAIPLTGGASTLAYLLGGGFLLGLTALAILRQQMRRRKAE